MESYKISIIGAGKVGTALGFLLQKKGFKIAAVSSRNKETLDKALAYIKAVATTDLVEAARLGEVIFITTKDDAIEKICCEIAAGGGFQKGNFVFHTSGALSNVVLKSAKESSAFVGSIHPMQSFADVEGAIRQLPHSVFGITAEEPALSVARGIVEALRGEIVLIKDEDKPLYHAAACVVSNYLVSLIYFSQKLYSHLKIEPKIALKAFPPLMKGTLNNVERLGTVDALTGPIARGDIETVKQHLDSLKEVSQEALEFYQVLGRETVEIAFEKKTIDLKTKGKLLEILSS